MSNPEKNGLAKIDSVQVFATGTHPTQDGPKEYSIADLDHIVANFTTLKVILDPTIVLGHEEGDEDGKFWQNLSTGVPSVGTVSRVWREGNKLMADFTDVLPIVANAILNKTYKKVSAEIYDDFEDQGKHFGMALRRVAILGGEIPQVKSLADLPMPIKQFSETKHHGKTTWVCYNGACCRIRTFAEMMMAAQKNKKPRSFSEMMAAARKKSGKVRTFAEMMSDARKFAEWEEGKHKRDHGKFAKIVGAVKKGWEKANTDIPHTPKPAGVKGKIAQLGAAAAGVIGGTLAAGPLGGVIGGIAGWNAPRAAAAGAGAVAGAVKGGAKGAVAGANFFPKEKPKPPTMGPLLEHAAVHERRTDEKNNLQKKIQSHKQHIQQIDEQHRQAKDRLEQLNPSNLRKEEGEEAAKQLGMIAEHRKNVVKGKIADHQDRIRQIDKDLEHHAGEYQKAKQDYLDKVKGWEDYHAAKGKTAPATEPVPEGGPEQMHVPAAPKQEAKPQQQAPPKQEQPKPNPQPNPPGNKTQAPSQAAAPPGEVDDQVKHWHKQPYGDLKKAVEFAKQDTSPEGVDLRDTLEKAIATHPKRPPDPSPKSQEPPTKEPETAAAPPAKDTAQGDRLAEVDNRLGAMEHHMKDSKKLTERLQSRRNFVRSMEGTKDVPGMNPEHESLPEAKEDIARMEDRLGKHTAKIENHEKWLTEQGHGEAVKQIKKANGFAGTGAFPPIQAHSEKPCPCGSKGKCSCAKKGAAPAAPHTTMSDDGISIGSQQADSSAVLDGNDMSIDPPMSPDKFGISDILKKSAYTAAGLGFRAARKGVGIGARTVGMGLRGASNVAHAVGTGLGDMGQEVQRAGGNQTKAVPRRGMKTIGGLARVAGAGVRGLANVTHAIGTGTSAVGRGIQGVKKSPAAILSGVPTKKVALSEQPAQRPYVRIKKFCAAMAGAKYVRIKKA